MIADGTELWDVVASCVDAWLAKQKHGQPLTAIDEYIPSGPNELKSLVTIELAKAEMELAFDRGQVNSVADYLRRYPELRECTGGVPFDLVVDEIRLRRQRGEVDPAPFYRAYPLHTKRLEKLFLVCSSMTLSGPGRVAQSPQILGVGQIVEDFELLKLLGSGAFAQVFLARQSTMHRLVALKVSADRGDEAKTLAQLDHPHIVRVYDVRRLPNQRLRLLSMQYAPGGTLQNVINGLRSQPLAKRDGKSILSIVDRQLVDAGLPPPEDSLRRSQLASIDWCQTVCDIGIQLADALDYAHRLRVLHRDIKPANVLLTAEGSCKLADFNVSYSEALDGTSASSYFGGSLVYMSPEQLQATQLDSGVSPEDLGPPSDIYSLALVLWELLAMERPWPNDQPCKDWAATIETILSRRAVTSPQIPPSLQNDSDYGRIFQALRSALVFHRHDRIESAAEFSAELRTCSVPLAWNLMHPEANRWSRACCRFPLLMSAWIIFLPNALAGVFNYHYNLAWLTTRYSDSHSTFVSVSVLMNFVAFSAGGVFFLTIVGPLASRVAKRFRRRESTSDAMLEASTLIGHRTATFGLGLWVFAGFLFPCLLWARLPQFDTSDAIHFFLSLAICGAIAVAYPFLGMTMVATECWYSVLVGKQLKDKNLPEVSRRLLLWCDRYLLLAAGVPMLGVGLLLTQSAPVRPALLLLVLAGGLGLFVAFNMHRRVVHVLDVLKSVTQCS